MFTVIGAIVHRGLLEGGDPTGQWLDAVLDVVVDGVRPRSDDPPPAA